MNREDDARREAEAMKWLARLDGMETAQRDALLATLQSEDPLLHAEVLSYLKLAADADGSRHLLAAASQLLRAVRVPGDKGIIGPYRLLAIIGKGGMSVVWKAERIDKGHERKVALKLPRHRLEDEVAQARFTRERRSLANLDHPNIAGLIDAGIDEGQPYIALDLIDEAKALDVACGERGMGVRDRLSKFLDVLSAVDHAHRRLVVHRDLKPSNILMDKHSRVRLVDFGIAKLLERTPDDDGAKELTQDSGCQMTLPYAAPEQIRNDPIGVGVDVHALGVVLFKLLTGRLPYTAPGDDLKALRREVLERAAPRPSESIDPDFPQQDGNGASMRSWQAELRGDLDNIVLKALRKDIKHRYGTAQEFIADIQMFLAYRPVKARPPSPMYRAKLFILRNTAASSMAAFGLVVGVALAVVAADQYVSALEERTRAEAIRDFMFNLVAYSQRMRGAAVDPSGRQVIEDGIRLAASTFSDRPRLQGEIQSGLVRTLMALRSDPAEDERLLREAVELLRRNAPAGDVALAKASAFLADAYIRQGRLPDARPLAENVLASCISSACAKPRCYAHSALGRIASRKGDFAQARYHLDSATAACEQGFGPADRETALAYLAAAVTARQDGRLAEAAERLDHVLSLKGATNLPAAERMTMIQLRAAISLDLGKAADAATLLNAELAAAQEPRLRSGLQRVLANAQLALGQPAVALKTAEDAVAGAGNAMERLLVDQALARAMSLLGHHHQALQLHGDVINRFLKQGGYTERSVELLRARRFLAEALAQSGDIDTAIDNLSRVVKTPVEQSIAQDVDRALSFQLLAEFLQRRGQVAEAEDLIREASLLLQRSRLSDDHPYRRRNSTLLSGLPVAAAPAGGALLATPQGVDTPPGR